VFVPLMAGHRATDGQVGQAKVGTDPLALSSLISYFFFFQQRK
jgi:hypothetical protein